MPNLTPTPEFDFVSQICKAAGMLAKGIGDDAFVSGKHLISADMSVEGTHFNLTENINASGRKNAAETGGKGGKFGLMTASDAVEKCLLANFSDINAMGGTATAILFSVCINKNWSGEIRREVASSVAQVCKKHKVKILGGDTTGGSLGAFSVTVFGKANRKILLRSTAKAGDDIWVSGVLGESAANSYARVPRPPLSLGKKLAAVKGIGACIDLSDSLSECLHILALQSKVKMRLIENLTPIAKFCVSGDVSGQSCNGNADKNFWLSGGEDYELLFTARKSARPLLLKIAKTQKITLIGSVEKGAGCVLTKENEKEEEIQIKGWKHF